MLMSKFVLLISLFAITSCSFSSKEQELVLENLSQYSDHNIREIMGHMEILDTDTNFPMAFDILTRSEKPCIGKDFIGYRECFLKGLFDVRKEYQITEKLDSIFSIFSMSIAEEITSFSLYKEVDDLSSMWVWAKKWECRLSWYRIFDQGAFTGQSVVISYWSSQKELANILSKSQNLSSKSLSGILLHENPCEWYTWWPDNWNIFYFSQIWENQYFFIKTSDGGWSGDFNYTIFWNHNERSIRENNYSPIATFPAYSWFTPIPQIIRDGQGNNVGMKHKEIIKEFKNRPFLYITLFENQRAGYIYQIVEILTDITPWVIFD